MSDRLAEACKALNGTELWVDDNSPWRIMLKRNGSNVAVAEQHPNSAHGDGEWADGNAICAIVNEAIRSCAAAPQPPGVSPAPDALAALKDPPESMALRFGDGRLVIDKGEFHGRPAVFIRPVDAPGVIGEKPRPEHQTPLDQLEPGETVLTFPTAEQANTVLDALFNRAAIAQAETVKAGASEGWTGRKCPDCKGSGFVLGEDRKCPSCGGTGDEYGPLYQTSGGA